MRKNENLHIGQSWKEFQEEIMTQEEIAASKARVKLMCQLADLREKEKLSQRNLSEQTGLAQSVISKMESGKTSPRVDTFINALSAIGYHLEIVPNEINP